MKTNFSIALYLSLSFFAANGQELKVPASSPLQSIRQDIALSSITIEYLRPSTRDRIVFGDLVPMIKSGARVPMNQPKSVSEKESSWRDIGSRQASMHSTLSLEKP